MTIRNSQEWWQKLEDNWNDVCIALGMAFESSRYFVGYKPELSPHRMVAMLADKRAQSSSMAEHLMCAKIDLTALFGSEIDSMREFEVLCELCETAYVLTED